MRKNVASQVVAFQMISTTDGSNVTTGTPAVYYTIDGGTQGTGSGTAAHEGNGQWSYIPTQAETNGNHVAFTMVLTGAVSQCVNVYPVSFDPTDSVRAGLTALPNAAAGAAGGLPTDSTGKTSFNDIAATAIVSGGAITTSGGAVSTVLAVTGAVGSVTAGVTVTTNNDKTGYALSAASIDAIWDEPIAGHLTAGTTGLSEVLGSSALVDSSITGTPTSTTFTFTGGSTSNNFYNDQLAYILSGTGIGQVRPILSSTYSGGTTTITVDEAFITTPAASDRFAILVSHVHPKSQIALAIISDGNPINATSGVIDHVALVDTTTTNTDMRGTDSAATASALATTDGKVDTINTNTAATQTLAAGVNGFAAIKTDSAAILIDTGTTLPALIDDLAIKKNTAFSNFEFLMVLTSDHVTPATGLTVTGQRSIDGGAFASVSGTIAEVSNGIYQFDALAADTNGDVITWRFSSATADDAFFTFKTVA